MATRLCKQGTSCKLYKRTKIRCFGGWFFVETMKLFEDFYDTTIVSYDFDILENAIYKQTDLLKVEEQHRLYVELVKHDLSWDEKRRGIKVRRRHKMTGAEIMGGLGGLKECDDDEFLEAMESHLCEKLGSTPNRG